MKLRQYQEESVKKIKKYEKNLIHLSTGSGKSLIFKHLIQENLNQSQNVLFIVHGLSILDQAINKHFLDLKNAFPLKNELTTNLACYSIDTLFNRKKDWDFILEKYKYIYIDEAHNSTRNSYTSFLDKTNDTHTIIGFSATPYKIGKKYHTFWTNVVHPISTYDLIKKNHLCFPKCFSVQTEMDTNVAKMAKDFNNKALFKANDNLEIYSSITKEYKKHGQNKKAICFAINIEHSKNIVKQFEKENIKAVHADATTDLEDRRKLINEFENGDVQILCNVNIFSTGVDIPCAEVGIMARPTRSKVLWIQQVGRLLRTYKDKKFAIILDHGGNILRLGHPINDFKAEITPKEEKANDDSNIKIYTCKNCFYIFQSKTELCPMCGAHNQRLIEERKIKERHDLELSEAIFIESEQYKKEKTWAFFIGKNFDQQILKEVINRLHEQEDKSFIKFLNLYLRISNDEYTKHSSHVISNIILNAYRNDHKMNSVFFKCNDIRYISSKIKDGPVKYPFWFKKVLKKNETMPFKIQKKDVL